MSGLYALNQSISDSCSINLVDTHTERSCLNAHTYEEVAPEETENILFTASFDSTLFCAESMSRKSPSPESIEHPTFEDIDAARSSPAEHAYSSVETRYVGEIHPDDSNPALLSYSRDPLSDDEISQIAGPFQAGACPTALTRSSYQRWFSTPLDILISLVPLLFLSERLNSMCETRLYLLVNSSQVFISRFIPSQYRPTVKISRQ